MLLELSQFFSPLYPPPPYTVPPPPPPVSPPPTQFMSMCCTYKFFGFLISYTILYFPLSILCLSSMLLIP